MRRLNFQNFILKRQPNTFILITTLVLVLTLVQASFAQLSLKTKSDSIKSEKLVSTSIDSVDHFVLPPRNNLKLAESAEALDQFGPIQFADKFFVNAGTKALGTWTKSNKGDVEVWRMMITSNGAKHLNLGFSKYSMPAGGELNIYSMINDDHVGPFTEADNEEHGQLWTPVIFSDQVLLEVIVPAKSANLLELEIDSINHGFRDFSFLGGKIGGEKSGSCNVDVVCSQGDDWRDEISSAGMYSISGTRACSGALINNTANDRTPYFLTADHCNVSAGNASSVVTYWNYQNTTCRAIGSGASGGNGDGPLTQFNSGAILRAEYSTSDMTLIEFDDPVNPDFSVAFAGWDRTGVNSSSVTAIHHPNVEEKRISFDFDSTVISTYLTESAVANGTHFWVTGWDIGTTEGGSSGSPLFDVNKRIIGQLHGGYASCTDSRGDWYGRFFRSWTGGGNSGSRLSDWLDPVDSGVMTLDTLTNEPPISTTISVSESESSDEDGQFEPGEVLNIDFDVLNETGNIFQNVTATLTANNENVTIINGVQFVASIPSSKSSSDNSENIKGINSPFPNQFKIKLDEDFICGDDFGISFSLSGTLDSESVVISSSSNIDISDSCNFLPEFVIISTSTDDSGGNGNDNGFVEPGESPISLTVNFENIGAPIPECNVWIKSDSSSFIPVIGDVVATFQPDNSAQAVLQFGVEENAKCGSTIPILIRIELNKRIFEQTIEIKLGDINLDQESMVATPGTVYGDSGFPTIVDVPFVYTNQENVTDVTVLLNIDHTWVRDNVISLISPAGTEVLLFNRRGESDDDDLTNTFFTDAVGTPISSGFAPFTGSFQPESQLSAFDGESIQGTWLVRFNDQLSGDTGTINRVELNIEYNSGDCSLPSPLDWQAFMGAQEVSCCDDVLDVSNPGGTDTFEFVIDLTNSGNSDLHLFNFDLGENISAQLPPSGTYQVDRQSSSQMTFEITDAKNGQPRTVSFSTNDPENPVISFEVSILNVELSPSVWVVD